MNVVITGASKGIGFETALAFSADPGNEVIAVSRDGEGLQRLQDKASANGNNNIHIHVDDISKLDHQALEAIAVGLGHIDILINNAGLLINKPFTELDIKEWRSMFEVNIFGAVEVTKALLPYLKKSRQAHIVNIGGMGGLQGTSKFPGLSAYSASKAALANFTECLAEELKEDNIKVNCLALGSVNTEMLKRAFPNHIAPVNPDEMAEFIAYFSEHAATLMNGKIIPVSINTP